MPVPVLPTSTLVRDRTDALVVDRLIEVTELTRAEIAATTGISKPTVSQSITRLTAAGVVQESGHQSGKRGPAGTYVRLRSDLGVAVAAEVGPAGLHVVLHDLQGRELHRVEHAVPTPVRAAQLSPLITTAIRRAVRAAPGPSLGCAVSVAGPIDQHTGRLVRLAYTPFLLDELAVRELVRTALGRGRDGRPVALLVDNDVNLAALAEHHEGAAADLSDFVYAYLGDGIGGAVVIDGVVQHGGRGLVGELAYVLTAGPGGRAMTLVQAVAAWGLQRTDSVAIDRAVVDRVLTGRTAADRRTRDALVGAVAGALGSAVAGLDPQAVLIGGPWSTIGEFDQRVAERVARDSVLPVEIRPASLGAEGPMIGARIEAQRLARAAIFAVR